MFIEITRVYRNNPYEHQMLLNASTILKVEPCDPREYEGNTRIVLDRLQEDNQYMVMYCKELYTQVALRIKSLYRIGLTTSRGKKKK